MFSHYLSILSSYLPSRTPKPPMQPLFAVHNNVSLLSVNIAPSTFLVVFVVGLVFLALYIPKLPSLSGLFGLFRRAPSNKDKDIILHGGRRFVRNPQTDLFEIDHGDNFTSPYPSQDPFYSGTSPYSQDPYYQTDWRHRQLPPLPPPVRPLLAGRDPEDDESVKKRRSSRSDRSRDERREKGEKGEKERKREREREKEREKEKARRKQDKGRSSPFKRKHSSSTASTSTATSTSAELVVHRSRQNKRDVDIYDSPSHLSDISDDDSRDQQQQQQEYWSPTELNTAAFDANGTSWVSFGALGRLTSRFRPGQQPASDAHITPPGEHPHQLKQTFGYPSTHSGFLETDSETESLRDSVSVGGYSPPAWRRLENGDLSAGFWRKSDNILGWPDQGENQFQFQLQPPRPANPFERLQQLQLQKQSGPTSRPSSPEFDTDDEDVVDAVLGFEDDDVFGDRTRGSAFSGYGGSGFLYGDSIGFRPTNGDGFRPNGDGFRPNGDSIRPQNDDDVLQRAMRTRLPGSMSPEKERSPEPDLVFPSPMTRMEGMRYKAMQSIREERMVGGIATHDDPAMQVPADNYTAMPADNYIRFAVRAEAEAQSRGKSHARFITRTWHAVVSLLVCILSVSAMRGLTQSAAGMHPVPDLVKVAGVARSFEPLIYYSEGGVAQVYDLEATGVAVWDLGESVRLSNLTSAPIIVKQLDDLSDTLRTLAEELTKFFANINGDVDAILYVMEWARRELSQLQPSPSLSSSSSLTLVTRPLTMAYDSAYSLLAYAGILENRDTGLPTTAGALTTTIFGMSGPQRTRAVLHRTFYDILQVLEEAVAAELQHTLALFALFQAVDQQFLNIVRTVAREASVQDAQRADLLAGLWTRILGPSAAATTKYERNRQLLRDVREKTVRNKGVLVEHNHRLLALKTSLENLRRRLVTPLVRSPDTVVGSLSLEEQIRGLEDVNEHLVRVRAEQKSRLMDTLYGIGTLRERVVGGGSQRIAIDES